MHNFLPTIKLFFLQLSANKYLLPANKGSYNLTSAQLLTLTSYEKAFTLLLNAKMTAHVIAATTLKTFVSTAG